MPQSAERFRSLSKSKGRTVWFVLLRLSKNFVFRTVSRSKPRFRAKPKKNRALQAHFFFPCINSEIRALGIYEFAPQILFYACCRTKHKRRNSAFLTDWGGMTSSRHCKYLHVVICGGGHPALQPCFYNSIISCLPHRKNIDFTRPIRYNHR